MILFQEKRRKKTTEQKDKNKSKSEKRSSKEKEKTGITNPNITKEESTDVVGVFIHECEVLGRIKLNALN